MAFGFETRPFEINPPNNGGISIALIGASRSGKTTLMKYLYNRFFREHMTVMFSQNTHADIYKDLPKKVMISPEYYPEIIRDMYQINNATENKFKFLVISDDFVNTRIKNDPEVLRALTIYRNAGVSSMWSFQGRSLMNAVGRNNVNYVAVLKQNTPLEALNVVKEYINGYFPIGMTYSEKVKFFMEATQNHQFFLIDNITGCCYLTKLSPEQAGLV